MCVENGRSLVREDLYIDTDRREGGRAHAYAHGQAGPRLLVADCLTLMGTSKQVGLGAPAAHSSASVCEAGPRLQAPLAVQRQPVGVPTHGRQAARAACAGLQGLV